MRCVRSIGIIFALTISLLCFFPMASPAGSPFYLTIERGFSITENPQIRLDYSTSSQPLLLRVLRPKNLTQFLDGQLNISRSYEKPLSELNPGHYFTKGLNKAESPLKVFRDMLGTDFRKSFKETPLHKTIVDPGQSGWVSTPTQIIQGPPEGFNLVKEYYVDLQYGGTELNDLGWWFSEQTWWEDRYKVRTIRLDPLPDGVYLIQAVQGKTEAQCLMQVSSLSVQVKQSTDQLVVRVINRRLDPVPQAQVTYRDSRGKWIDLGQKTNPFGEVSFTRPEGLDGRLVLRVETRDKKQALVDTDFLPAVSNNDSVFIMTDRPIFKPGETFFYKGIVRAFDRGNLKIPTFASKEAEITLVRFDGTPTDLQARVPLLGLVHRQTDKFLSGASDGS